MADRPNMPAYPMPNGFPMNLSQQQQQQQQHQQQQMMQQQMQANSNPLQASANFSTPDQRMWQLQRLQMENQRRAQMGVGDGMGPQMNPQMAELLRNQLLTHGQHAQMQPNQMQQSSQGPQYGNAGQMGQMNAMNIGQAAQHQQAIGQLQQSHPQLGMGGAGQNLNPSQASALLARGMNPAMLSVIQNNPRMVNRQMNLLNTARNQQPQNGPAAFPPNNLPFNNGQIPFQTDPRAPQQGQVHPMNGNPSDNLQAQFAQFVQEFMRTKDGRQLSPDEIRMKVLHFKRDIDADKVQISQLSNNVTQETLPLLKQKQQLTLQKEVFFSRLQQLLLQNQARAGAQQQQPSSGSDGGAGPSNLNMQTNLGTQQSQLAPNAGWVAQENRGNPSGPISTPNLANAQPVNGHPQLSTSPFHPSLVQRQQTTPVPRMGPTPQQQHQAMEALMRQSHPSPQRGPTPAAPGQNRPPQPMQAFEHVDGQRTGMGSLPSLDRAKFEEIIKQWWQQNNIIVEERMLAVGDRRIDLYDLYLEVTRLGGAVAVNRHELWPVVAAKLGWANIPAQSSEPARSGPQAANHMKVVYDAYVISFEQQVSSANLREFLSGHGHRDHQSTEGGPNHPPGPQGQSQPQAARPPLPAAQIQLLNLVRFANTSADVLRRNNVPESIIQQVEVHRVALQRQYQIQLQRNPGFLQGTPSNANMQNLSNQQQIQMSNLGGFIGGQSQNGNLNQSFNIPGSSAGPSGQNGFGSTQHPSNGQMGQPSMEKSNQQRWNEANVAIARLKEEYARERNSQPTVPRDISDVEKGQINAFFEGFVRLANDIEKILPMFFYLCNDMNSVKHLVSIVDIVTRQRKFLQSPNPIYIIDLNTLKKLYYISNQARDKFQEMIQRQKLQDPGRLAAPNMPQPPPGPGGMPVPAGPQPHPAMQGQMSNAGPVGLQRPPSRQPQPSQIPPHLMQAPPVNRPPMMPPARPPSVSQGRPPKAENAHSPAAPASTPGPSASTPNTLASPQTPKSPKPKAKPKGQAKQRRPSKAVAPTTSAASASTAPPQGPNAENSLKRQREDDNSSSALGRSDGNNDAGTPAKRVKGEWDETPDAGPSNMQKEIENIKTPEKAAQFYKDMSQLMEILQNPNDSNSAGLDSDILETLATVAASCIPQEGSDHVLSSELNGKDSSPKLGTSGVDALFNEFLDFTSFTQDDEKIDTPDLIPSSSTNPSPESNAETDNHPSTLSVTGGEVGNATDIKFELPADNSDLQRLGIWGELDGGESSYYTSDSMWKWDGSSSSESSWAIST